MAHFPDLSSLGGLGSWEPVPLAIGWLDPSVPYATGAVSPACFSALVRLLVDPWQPAAAGGSHRCGFCRFSGGPGELRHDGLSVRLGASNLFVPSGTIAYCAPSLVLHYIDAHGYCPPEPFFAAVLACPEMRSVAYLRALRAAGLVAAR
jgi:hypothetical protein